MKEVRRINERGKFKAVMRLLSKRMTFNSDF